jgi:hypothetical protein
MIYLNEQQLNNIDNLSMRFQYLLSMIDGGFKWMEWAINDGVMTTIYTVSENQLLELIQEGLYADEYIRFNTFRTSLRKVLTLSDDDIEQLSIVYKTNNDNDKNLKVLLHRNGMLSYAELNKITDFLTIQKQTRPDLFQFPSFEDQIALTNFVNKQKKIDPAILNQAYVFASGIAATVQDFINLCYFFQSVLGQKPQGNLIPATQNSYIQSIYSSLLATSFYLLFTPNAGPSKNEYELLEVIPELAKNNNFIGYSTVTSSVLNLLQNIKIDVNNPAELDLDLQINDYLSAVKQLVSFTRASDYMLSQDGKQVTLRFEKEEALAIIGVDEGGNVIILPGSKININ